MQEITTIRISKSLHNRLIEKGKKGDTFEDIIGRLLEAEDGL